MERPKTNRELAIEVYNAITRIDWEDWQFSHIKLAIRHKEELNKLVKNSKGK
tara:strand:- start:703 stop:858 length:156 start_codon:yes stop_codon:yes gene_type:complete